jgi:hypothetical protein
LRGVFGNIDGRDIRQIYPEKLHFTCEKVNVFYAIISEVTQAGTHQVVKSEIAKGHDYTFHQRPFAYFKSDV